MGTILREIECRFLKEVLCCSHHFEAPLVPPFTLYYGFDCKQKPHCTMQEGTSWLCWRTVCRCDSVGIHPGHSRVSNWFSNWGHWSPMHQNSEPCTWISWYYSRNNTRHQIPSELNTNLNAGMAQMFLGINHIV